VSDTTKQETLLHDLVPPFSIVHYSIVVKPSKEIEADHMKPLPLNREIQFLL